MSPIANIATTSGTASNCCLPVRRSQKTTPFKPPKVTPCGVNTIHWKVLLSTQAGHCAGLIEWTRTKPLG